MLDYFDVLADLHRSRRPTTYLEIGVFRGDALRLASEDAVCVGVDPEPVLEPGNGGHCHIEAMTSDAFFASPRPRELFGDRPIDMVFIDGMHLFEYALRDFNNAEALSTSESIILVHDCLPRDAVTASRERTTDHWTGDVWKLVLCLLDCRPNLDLSIIDVPPSGLCVIRRLDPSDNTLRDAYNAIVEKYRPLGFEAWEARSADVLQRTTNNPEAKSWSRRKEFVALRDRLAESEAESAALRDRLAKAETMRERLARSETRTRELEAQLRLVSASTSWRLTAPLRRVGASVRRRGA
jgi:predicted O-methyltransferase YrrM